MANAEKNIILALQAILQRNTTVNAYVNSNNIFMGVRDNVPQNSFPVIFLEPDVTDEELSTVPRGFILTIKVKISCVMLGSNYDTQIVGNAPMKGIYDFTDDVKNAIDAYPDLNYDGNHARTVDFFRFPTTRYHYQFFPFRFADITFQGRYKTPGGAR